jgi:MSHA biogenesis protein MshP
MFRSRQRGVGLIAAVFLIVVVAALAVAIASLVRSNSNSFARDVLSYRAFLAADSGAQLALNRVFAPVGAPSCATRTYAFTQTGLEGCRAIVTCSALVVAGQQRYDVESHGRCTTATDVAERRIDVRATAP